MSTRKTGSSGRRPSADITGNGLTRRRFIAAGTAAGAAAGGLGSGLASAGTDDAARAAPPPKGRTLLRGGIVLTLDDTLGDFDRGDVLIDDGRIAQVAPDIDADATIVEADGMIVMPGFVDTHRHMWQGQLRNILPNGRLRDYGRHITGTARSHYQPEDAYIGNLVSALGAIHAGVTTVLDWSHIGNSPAHTDAAIAGLRDSGLRAVYAFGSGSPSSDNAWPGDLARLRAEHFNSGEQLLTLALAGSLDPEPWAHARKQGAFISVHVNGTDTLPPLSDELADDLAYIHCCNLSDAEWRLIAETGGGVSIAAPVEMQMGHGVPPFQQALNHQIPISLSNDVETSVSGEFFTQMRMAFALQRMLVHGRERAGEDDTPALLEARDIVGMATRGGAEVNRLQHRVGTLTPGKRADIIVLDTQLMNVAPLNDAYGAVVTAMDTSNVRHVFIDGRPMKWHGRLITADTGDVLRRAEASRDAIVRRAGWRLSRFGTLPD